MGSWFGPTVDGAESAAQGVELGERGAVGPDAFGGAQPSGCLGAGEAADLDLGQAATGAGDCWVKHVQRLVGGDGHDDVEALAEQAVGEV